MVQLEIMHEGNWKEAVRYDCAHGYAHRDSYDLRGKHTKEELQLSFEHALTFGNDVIDENWENYRDIFLAGGIP